MLGLNRCCLFFESAELNCSEARALVRVCTVVVESFGVEISRLSCNYIRQKGRT